MSSALRLTIGAGHADASWRAVEHLFGEVERTLTRFDRHSPLTELNLLAGSGRPLRIPEILARALAVTWRAYRVSAGMFDPRIIGALEANGERAGVPLRPSSLRLIPNERWLTIDVTPEGRTSAALSAPIDLGGIGKGLALRWAGNELVRSGVHRFLLEAGGDILAGAPPDGMCGWRIAIAHPSRTDPAAVIEAANCAVATSSCAVHATHLIDPRTLRPASAGMASVTVMARDPAWAEVWTKVGFIDGVARLAERTAWWTDARGGSGLSRAAQERTAWRR